MTTKIIHCSYHKCLTVYYSRVMWDLQNRYSPLQRDYKHFDSNIDEFYAALDRRRVLSVNNHFPDFNRLGDFKISRFIRDPRDLIVSGYHYHKRGAEPWTNIVDPGPEDLKIVNGNVPVAMPKGFSIASYLQSLNEENGLLAEIEIRKHHMSSMRDWPHNNPRILTIKYEDILGNEVKTFGRLFEFYEFGPLKRRIGKSLASKYSSTNMSKTSTHIRDPSPNQWKEYFTPAVVDFFNTQNPDLLTMYGYD